MIEDISKTHFIIMIKLEVSIFSIVLIFYVVVSQRWLYHPMLSVSLIYIPGNMGFVSFIAVHSYNMRK